MVAAKAAGKRRGPKVGQPTALTRIYLLDLEKLNAVALARGVRQAALLGEYLRKRLDAEYATLTDEQRSKSRKRSELMAAQRLGVETGRKK